MPALVRDIGLRYFSDLFGSYIWETIMSGWSSAQSRIRHLGKKSQVVEQGNRVSVVYMDDDGIIDWPPNPAAGVMVIPKTLSIEK